MPLGRASTEAVSVVIGSGRKSPENYFKIALQVNCLEGVTQEASR